MSLSSSGIQFNFPLSDQLCVFGMFGKKWAARNNMAAMFSYICDLSVSISLSEGSVLISEDMTQWP